MGNGFGPLWPQLREIRYKERVCPFREREYFLSCSWTSAESWVGISGITEDDIDRDSLSLPTEVAVKVAAAILYSEACYDPQFGLGENLAAVAEDLPALRRVLDHILAIELNTDGMLPRQ